MEIIFLKYIIGNPKSKIYFLFFYRNRKRMYQVDCMTKKINVNFLRFMRENKKYLGIENYMLMFFKKNMKFTSKSIIEDMERKCPQIKSYFNLFLSSENFKKMFDTIELKHDDEYKKIFLSHVKNYKRLFEDNLKNIQNQSDKKV